MEYERFGKHAVSTHRVTPLSKIKSVRFEIKGTHNTDIIHNFSTYGREIIIH